MHETIIRITAAPSGYEHTMHDAGFMVLEWSNGQPVIALHGTRQPLDERWAWTII